MHGFTLVELMVALTISAILTAGAIQIFYSSRAGFRSNEALARVQENGRFSMNFLAQDVRGLAGFGCAQQPEVTSQLDSGGGFSITGPAIQGGEGTGIDIIRATGPSDSLTIRTADAKQTVGLSENIHAGENVKVTAPDPDVDKGDILMITDCANADVFQVSSPPSGSAITHNAGGSVSPGNNANDLSTDYARDGNVFPARETIYSLGTDAAGNPQLERAINGAAPEVLVDNVVDLQFRYGEDFDNDNVANAYIDASQVSEWDEVIAVRTRVTIRSNEQAITEDPVQLDFNGDGADEAAPDNRLYQTFTTTTAIRNRLP